MNNPHYQTIDLKLNRLVNSAFHVLGPLDTQPSATDIFGMFGFTNNSHNLPGHLAICEDDTSGLWIYLAALNKPEEVTARWKFAPGGNAFPPPVASTTDGQYAPFAIDGEAELDGPKQLGPDVIPANPPEDRPAIRWLGNWTKHLQADMLDGYHSTHTVTPWTIPARHNDGNITVPLQPAVDSDAASKWYVDDRVTVGSRGIRPRTWVRLISLSNIAGTPAGSPATLTITGTGVLNPALTDGKAVALNDRIILNGQTDKLQNGVFKVNPISPNFVLTREPGATDPDGKGAYQTNDYFPVTDGNTQKGSAWIIDTIPTATSLTTIVWGTNQVQFLLYDAPVSVDVGLGLKSVGGIIHFKNETYAAINEQLPFFNHPITGADAVGNLQLFEQKATVTSLTGYQFRIPYASATNKADLVAGLPVFKNGPAVFNSVDTPATTRWSVRPAIPADAGAPNFLLDLGEATDLKSINRLYLKFSADTNAPSHVAAWKQGEVGTELNRVHGIVFSNFAGHLVTHLDAYYPRKTTALEIKPGDSYITVSAPNSQDISANRSWTIGFNAAISPAPWIPTEPPATGTIDVLVAWKTAGTQVKNSLFQQNTGGTKRLEPVSGGQDVDLGSAPNPWRSIYAILTAGASGTTDFIRWNGGLLEKRTLAQTRTDLGLSALTLTSKAVAFGNSSDVLTGDINRLSFDPDLVRLGINQPAAQEKLHVVGNARFDSGRISVSTSATPLALLDLGAGTTAVSPIKLSGTGNALLTSALAGAVETDNARLYFTDSTPLRHGIAFLDDINFTNDSAAARAGAVAYGGGANSTITTLNAGAVTHPVTIFLRWSEIDGLNGQYSPFYTTLATAGQRLFGIGISSGGQLTVNFYDAAGVFRPGAGSIVDFRNKYLSGGRIADVALVKNTNAILVYVNGVLASTASPAFIADPVGMDSAGWVATGANPFAGHAYAGRIYNRALTAAEVLKLSRYGVDSLDQWGDFPASYTSDFSNADPTLARNGWTIASGSVVDGNIDGIAGENDWLRINRTDLGGYIASRIVSGGLKRLRIEGKAFVPLGSPHSFVAISSAGASPPAYGAIATTPDTAFNFLTEGVTNFTTSVLYIGGSTSSATSSSSVASANPLYLKSIKFYAAGCVVDVNFGFGCGSVLPDRSGKYPTTLTGAGWTHHLSTCPVIVPKGPGTIQYGIKKYVEILAAVAQSTDKTITHDLGTEAVTVEVWNGATPRQKIEVGVQKVASFETTQLIVSFGAFGPTPQNMMVVVTG